MIAQSKKFDLKTKVVIVDEFKIISQYFERKGEDNSVRVGIGDDGAVLSPDRQKDLIAVVD